MAKKLILVLVYALMWLVLVQSICKKETPTEPKNQPPLIASLTATPSTLDWSETSQLVVIAADPEGQSLTYSWVADGGTFSTETTRDTVVWQAPDSSGSFSCTATVSDGKAKASESITLTVTEHPILSLDKDSLSFGSTTTSLSFNITNTGTGRLDWSITTTTDDGGTWITSTTPSQGSATTNQVEQVTVQVDRSGLADGTYRGWVKITSDGGNDSVRVVMNMFTETAIFSDDFSGTLSEWTTTYCDAWISNGEAHVKGNRSGYYGTLYHNLSSYVTYQYTVNMKLARVSSASSNDYYGLYTGVNDTGYPAIPYFWFTIWPGSSDNWAVLAFLSAGTSSQWAYLASDSKGYSSLIKTDADQWNDVSWTIESDKTLTVKIGGATLYQTDEIRSLETVLGRTINMDLKKIGIRTIYNFEVKADDVLVSKAGLLLTGLGTQGSIPLLERAADRNSTVPPVPLNLDKLPTLEEVLRGLLRK